MTNRGDVLSKTLLNYTPVEIDYILCQLSAALCSLRASSISTPLPLQYKKDKDHNEYDLEKIKTIIDSLPSINEWMKKIKDNEFNEEQIDFIEWLLKEDDSTIHYDVKENLCDKQISFNGEEFQNSNLQVKLRYGIEYERKWKMRSEGKSVKRLLHGTKFENLHSITHFGLLSHLSKDTNLFGDGIYLTDDIGLSKTFSKPSSLGVWTSYNKRSLFNADSMSALIVCDVIQDEIEKKSINKKNEIPDNYFVVRNNELIRIHSIVIYTKLTNSTMLDTQSLLSSTHLSPDSERIKNNAIYTLPLMRRSFSNTLWLFCLPFQMYPLTTIVLIYASCLMAVGLRDTIDVRRLILNIYSFITTSFVG
ncbi:hypothetical protein SNEBB_005971 [Seison nebaliae]|nr:hypothetical protein SNEBB_005971 [Seison nebaliae]